MTYEIPIDVLERAIDSSELSPGEVTLDRAYPTAQDSMQTCAAICCTETGTPFKVIDVLNSDEETQHYASKLLDRLQVHNKGDGYCFYFPGVAFTGPVGRYDEQEG